MTLEEKKDLMVAMGLSEKTADWYLQYESDVWAVLPTFRFLKPLSDDLEFYKGGYRKMLEKRIEDGTLDKRFPIVAALRKEGASLETIEKFAYDLMFEAYESLLYHLDDPEGAEVDDCFLGEGFSRCSHGQLAEMGPDGYPTGRFLMEVHGKIPFSELNEINED
ncbi:MAG: hypothetical protein HFI19_05270 [Lachnospiraceae bacterium]|nr:hypothetical protein [Lachnospiraceae bacterium]